jgi:hypothetical protein
LPHTYPGPGRRLGPFSSTPLSNILSHALRWIVLFPGTTVEAAKTQNEELTGQGHIVNNLNLSFLIVLFCKVTNTMVAYKMAVDVLNV